MIPVQLRERPTVGQLARTHTFRFLTMIATWALIFAAFVPEWIRAWLRLMTYCFKAVADQVPEPWGAHPRRYSAQIGRAVPWTAPRRQTRCSRPARQTGGHLRDVGGDGCRGWSTFQPGS